MTLAANELSRHAGDPVELYKFVQSFEDPGGSIIFNGGGSGDGVGHYGVLTTVLTTTGSTPPPSYHDSGQIEFFRTRWAGAIGQENGSTYQPFTITNLTAGKNYRATVPSVTCEPNGFLPGARFGAPDAAPQAATNGVIQATVTADANGELYVALGLFGIQYSTTIFALTFGQMILEALPEEDGGTDPPALADEEINYTSADVTVTFGGSTYLPAIFTRSAFRVGERDSGPAEVSLTMPRNHAVAQWFQDGLPVRPVKVTIYRIHRDDIAAGTSYATPFIGQVQQAEFRGPSCVLTLASIQALLDQKRPRLLVQRQCANFLYDGRCQLGRESFRYDGTITALTGFNVTISGLAAEADTDTSRFANGFLLGPSGEALHIEAQNGDTVTLLNAPQTLVLGDAVRVYPGCDRTPATCHARFNNIRRFNGLGAMLPTRNPFGPAGFNAVL